MKNPKNNFGFGAIGVVIVVLVLAVVGMAGYIVWDRAELDDGLKTTSQQTSNEPVSTTQQTKTQINPNEGYFVVKEWGLRFIEPSGLEDVQYKITGDTLAFYAKPKGLGYQYVNNYTQVDSNGTPSLAIGVVFRSNESTKDKIGYTVTGKKIGGYYYYTAWSFSSLATGAACLPLYDMADQEAQCVEMNKAFALVNNGESSLLRSIELEQ